MIKIGEYKYSLNENFGRTENNIASLEEINDIILENNLNGKELEVFIREK